MLEFDMEIELIGSSERLKNGQSLNWKLRYVQPSQVFPEFMTGLPVSEFEKLDSSHDHFTPFDYVKSQFENELGFRAVRDAIGRFEDFDGLDSQWLSVLKFYL